MGLPSLGGLAVAFDLLAEQAECPASRTFQNCPLWMAACQHPQPHDCCQQQLSDVGRVNRGRNTAVVLAGDHAAPEERLQFRHPGRDDRGDGCVMWCDLECRIGQQAAQAIFQ